MQQKELTKVIDEWSDAVAALAVNAPPELKVRLTTATSDLLEAFASSATNLAAGATAHVLRKLEALTQIAEHDAARLDQMDERIDLIVDHGLDVKEVS